MARRRKSGLRGPARESDIVYETPVCWVKDGLSIAVARCNYLTKRAATEKR